MNNGVIAQRYAKAFFDLVMEHGSGRPDSPECEKVYAQVRVLLSLMGRMPEFSRALCDPRLASLQEKISLMGTAVAPEPLCEDISNLMTLMHRNCRDELFRIALLDFLTLYRQSKGLVMVQVTTATGSHNLDSYISELARDTFGGIADISVRKDPDLIGGFIIDSWGYRLDASVRTQLQNLRKSLTAITKRSV